MLSARGLVDYFQEPGTITEQGRNALLIAFLVVVFAATFIFEMRQVRTPSHAAPVGMQQIAAPR